MLKWVGISAIAWVALSQAAVLQASSAPGAQVECEMFSEPHRFNTRQPDGPDGENVIVIGRQPDRPYQVVVTMASEATFAEIRACVPDAYLTRSRIGRYIQVASFSNRQDAETIHRILLRYGYPARLFYHR